MTETLFERYKEALRAGHVAVVRGRLEAAATAYREAIEIAADRALPRTALGGVLLRLGDPVAALEACDGALALAPDDDAALVGRAQALVVLRRTSDAAATYDRLAAIREREGRPDAVEAARRALAIEPTAERRRRHDELTGGRAQASAAGAGEPEPPVGEHEAAAAPEPVAVSEAAAAPEPPTALPVDAEGLVVDAEAALDRGDRAAAGAAALAAAVAYADQGHDEAAADACLLGIEAVPADPDLHLLLARLGIGRAGAPSADETNTRLLRLAELDGDEAAMARVRAAAAPAAEGEDPAAAPNPGPA